MNGPEGSSRQRSGSKRGAWARRGRALRIAALLVVNAALVFVLWKVVSPRLLARDRATAEVGDASATGSAQARTPESSPALEPTLVAARRDRALEERLRAIVSGALGKAEKDSRGKAARERIHVAVHVRDAADGAEIVALGAERAQRPASNLKLVTTGAALVLLGAEWRFQTALTSDAPVANGVLAGDLVVRAAGDPLYDATRAGDVGALLAPAIAALRAQGIGRIAGDLVLDEGRFQEPAPGPAWPAEGQRWSDFCALAGGFSANGGCITARVRPGKPGGAARVEVRPAGHGLPERIDVRTGPARSKLDVRVAANGGTVIVEGSFPANVDAWECRFAAPDPVALFGNALRHELAAAGIALQGGVRRERTAPRPSTRVLAEVATPLVDVLVPINAHSDNAVADQLFLALGNVQFGAGTRDGGRRATSLALARLGVPEDEFTQVDGSGLSRDNRVSARQITALVAGVVRRGGPAARAFLDSMAAPKADGTLDQRLAGLEGRVRAKTGFIGGTSALSGVVETDGGRTLAFSILVEYPVVDGLNVRVWKPMQDEICRTLAGNGS